MALMRAKELDEYYAKNGKTVGPLHGLPISLKDQFRIKVRSGTHDFCIQFHCAIEADGHLLYFT